MATLGTVERLHSSAQWALVERVLASQQFRRSARLQKFLRDIASRSIDHEVASIPEQEIGIAVFGKRPDYDTQIDNIVRVSAGDLRRRLDHYFLDEGIREEIILEMPRGYALTFRRRQASSQRQDDPPRVAEASEQKESSNVLESPHEEAAELRADWKRWWLDIRTLILFMMCLSGLAFGFWSAFRSHREPWQQTRSLQLLWSPYFGNSIRTNLVLGDSSLALVKSITHSGVSLSDYLGYGYKQVQTDPGLDPATRAALYEVLTRNIGSLGDFEAARNILQLTDQPAQFMLGSAHDFSPDAIRGSNLILVGSNVLNPWVDLYRDQRSLILENEVPGSVAGIRNFGGAFRRAARISGGTGS